MQFKKYIDFIQYSEIDTQSIFIDIYMHLSSIRPIRMPAHHASANGGDVLCNAREIVTSEHETEIISK